MHTFAPTSKSQEMVNQGCRIDKRKSPDWICGTDAAVLQTLKLCLAQWKRAIPVRFYSLRLHRVTAETLFMPNSDAKTRSTGSFNGTNPPIITW
jgi:hypothetical protein